MLFRRRLQVLYALLLGSLPPYCTVTEGTHSAAVHTSPHGDLTARINSAEFIAFADYEEPAHSVEMRRRIGPQHSGEMRSI